MYADTESVLSKCSRNRCEGPKPATTSVSDHKAMSYRLRIMTNVNIGIPLDSDNVGMDTPVKFMKRLSVIDKLVTIKLKEIRDKNKTIVLTREKEEHFQDAEKCCF